MVYLSISRKGKELVDTWADTYSSPQYICLSEVCAHRHCRQKVMASINGIFSLFLFSAWVAFLPEGFVLGY